MQPTRIPSFSGYSDSANGPENGPRNPSTSPRSTASPSTYSLQVHNEQIAPAETITSNVTAESAPNERATHPTGYSMRAPAPSDPLLSMVEEPEHAQALEHARCEPTPDSVNSSQLDPQIVFEALRSRLDDSLDALEVRRTLIPGSAFDQSIKSDFLAVAQTLSMFNESSDEYKVIQYKNIALTGVYARETAAFLLKNGYTDDLPKQRNLLIAKSRELNAMPLLEHMERYSEEFKPNSLAIDMQRMAEKIDMRLPFLRHMQTAHQARDEGSQKTVADSEYSIRTLFLNVQSETLDLIAELPKATHYSAARLSNMLNRLEATKHFVNAELTQAPVSESTTASTQNEAQAKTQFFNSLRVDLFRCQNTLQLLLAKATATEIQANLYKAQQHPANCKRLVIERLQWLLGQTAEIQRIYQFIPRDEPIPVILADVADACDNALNHYAIELKTLINAEAHHDIVNSALSDADQSLLLSSLSDLPALSPHEALGCDEAALRLINTARNAPIIYSALAEFSQDIDASPHLHAPQKQDLLAWLCRLSDNKRALLFQTEQEIGQFTDMTRTALTQLLAQPTLAQRLAHQVEHAAHNAACTDWAATTLIDMLAIAESSDLEADLAARRAEHQRPASQHELAAAFISDNRNSLQRLLRYSAFRAYMQESAIRDESVEMGLYLYRQLQSDLDLPGSDAANRMQYVEYTERAFGSGTLKTHLHKAREALSDEQLTHTDHKLLLLDNLALFNIPIWSDLKALVGPETAPDTTALEAQRESIYERLNSLDPNDPEHLTEINRLQLDYNRLSSARETAAANNATDKQTLQDLAGLI